MTMHRTLLLTAAMILLAKVAAASEEAAKQPQTTAEAPAEQDIPTLIQELDADRFSKRQVAGQKLKQLGKTAIPAITEAALGASREAAARAFEILKEHFDGGDAETKDAAKQALQKLAASDKPAIARNADDVLNPKPNPPAGIGQAVPMGGQIQIQFQGGILAGGGQQIQMKTVNGVKEITVKENDRQIKINDDPDKGIRVEVTEKIEGKETTRKFEAKNADELKKNHPEAHQLYEKYQQGGGFQIQIGQGGVLPFGINPPGVPPAAPQLDRRAITEQLDKVSRQLDDLREALKGLPTEDAQSLRKALEQLENAKKSLQEARGKLGG
ncbi:MAG: hypothetical protein FJ276_13310 [Planctomycetes bacterium]|nr:hypothetical protein [Planctomycetota bacterium]